MNPHYTAKMSFSRENSLSSIVIFMFDKFLTSEKNYLKYKTSLFCHDGNNYLFKIMFPTKNNSHSPTRFGTKSNKKGLYA